VEINRFRSLLALRPVKFSDTNFALPHEQGGFPVDHAALGSCDLSILHMPLHIAGEWQWLVRQDGRDMEEGAALSADDAKQEAETVALRLLGPAP
jgi:hypothetical protein